jgi:uncharacterized repeat protein (TIGR04042 family)
MPEIRFQIQWSDGEEEICYSPSLIVKEYFTPDIEYELEDFVSRSRTALNIASERVRAKYGSPCGLALGQLQAIEVKATHQPPDSKVRVIRFIE